MHPPYITYLDRICPFVLVAIPLENGGVQEEIVDLSAEPEAPLALEKTKKTPGGGGTYHIYVGQRARFDSAEAGGG